jgi:hypothetical protein
MTKVAASQTTTFGALLKRYRRAAGLSMDIREYSSQPLWEVVRAQLQEQQELLLLDNFEHVLAERL